MEANAVPGLAASISPLEQSGAIDIKKPYGRACKRPFGEPCHCRECRVSTETDATVLSGSTADEDHGEVEEFHKKHPSYAQRWPARVSKRRRASSKVGINPAPIENHDEWGALLQQWVDSIGNALAHSTFAQYWKQSVQRRVSRGEQEL